MPKSTSKAAQERELLLLHAINAYKTGQVPSLRSAADIYKVPFSTLQSRFHGRASRAESTKRLKLTEDEEQTLISWIISLAYRGYPPKPAIVTDSANALLQLRNGGLVGKNWVSRFVQRTEEVRIITSRRYDFHRARTEDPEVIQDHFQRLQQLIIEYGVLPEDIYNMDEIGFLKGDTGRTKVVTSSDGPRWLVSPGNREWTTVIEAISWAGNGIPAMVINKGKLFLNIWFDEALGVPPEWLMGDSVNGWTNDRLGLIWLTEVFHKHTKNHIMGVYRLLIMDGHGSHCTHAFEDFARQNNIIPFYLPAHSSHITQPLDVGVFSVVKRRYRERVQELIRNGQTHVDYTDFLKLYKDVRPEAITQSNVFSAFEATGVVPLNPSRVLDKLVIRVNPQSMQQATTPDTSSISSLSNTPLKIRSINKREGYLHQRQIESNRRSDSPSSRIVSKMAKAAKMLLQEAQLLKEENQRLRVTNNDLSRKRSRNVKRFTSKLTSKEAITVAEGREINHQLKEANQGGGEPSTSASQATPRRCTLCRQPGHTRNRCLAAPGSPQVVNSSTDLQ